MLKPAFLMTLTALLAICLQTCAMAKSVKLPIDQKGMRNVMHFGAKGDGQTDDTKAFQKGLDAVAQEGGGILFVPTGNYLIKGRLSIPDNVTLEGVFRAPTARSQYKGSTLLAIDGKGSLDGDPFILLHNNSCIKGITVFYPEQNEKNPVPYPWCIRGNGDNCSIVDVLLVNPYQAVDFGTFNCGRHLIRNLYAHALFKGLFIDKCFDVGRVENVHFWPFWSFDPDLRKFMETNATAFILGRSDWQMMNGLFCIWYKVGFHFIANKEFGPGNYMITNSGSDEGPCAVLADSVQGHSGVCFTNCQFMAGIETSESNTGPLKFVNCGFWGVQNVTGAHANLKGSGHVTFDSCHFVNWDTKKEGTPCIIANNRGIKVSSCDFMDRDKKQIILKENVKSAIIIGNSMRGGVKIENNSKGKVEIGLNADE